MVKQKIIGRSYVLFVFIIIAVFISTSSFADVIVDNGGAGSSSTGTWSNSGGADSYGTTSEYARPEATYTWQFDSQPPGEYEVLMWWTEVSTRGTNIQVEINHALGTDTVYINQMENGGQWNSLGMFEFGPTGSVRITASGDLTSDGSRIVSTSADAVWFRSTNEAPTAVIDNVAPNPADIGQVVSFTGHGDDIDGSVVAYRWASDRDGTLSNEASFATDQLSEGIHEITFMVRDDGEAWSEPSIDILTVGDEPVEITVDNGTSGTSSSGTWRTSGGSDPYGSGSLYARPDATYSWAFDSQPSGEYEVSMWWTFTSTRGPHIQVDVNHALGTDTVYINQMENGGQWNSLGSFSFDGSGSVTITASEDMTSNGSRVVSTCADAVTFSLISSNTIPSAIIDNIDPNPADVGEAVTFTGHGNDEDGSVVAYSWNSNRDGALSDLASFTTDGLSEGEHEISFRVQDDGGKWSTAAIESLRIGNVAPTATVDDISPNPADVGETVSFTGHGDDLDGSVAGYRWISNLDDLISNDASFSTDSLSSGVHEITFSVQDDRGMWSSEVLWTLTVGNQVPTAFIDSILPNPCYLGSDVTVIGHGDDPDGTITNYTWMSNINGLLGNDASFTINTLSEGVHAISLVVYDDDGESSAEAVQFLTVSMFPVGEVVDLDNGSSETSYTGTWSVSGGSDPLGAESLYARPDATYTWNFAPPAPGYYEVFLWWTTTSTRGSNVLVTITCDSGIETAYIDQTTDGGQWNRVGSYLFTSSGSVMITASSELLPDGRTVSTCADGVRFEYVGPITVPPVADFSSDQTAGGVPFTVGFSDQSSGEITGWLWDFGDGSTSTEENPSHEYVTSGTYDVSLTVTNDYGTDTIVKTSYIQVLDTAVENIYIALGWGSNWTNWTYTEWDILDIGGIEIEPDLWQYTNTAKGVTYYIRPIDTVEAFEAAIKESGAHIIYIGHSNYGWGLSFIRTSQQDTIRFFDDPLVSNVSTDMTDPSIPGLRFGQAYPNWNPQYSFGGSAIMPYDFGDPSGPPPHNYFATYTLPGDPMHYRIEAADGSYIERFPDSGRPAWYSPDGSTPDPVLNSEYFITNTSVDWERCEFAGTWGYESPGDWHNVVFYLGQNYQYHTPGVGNNSATFRLPIKIPGVYAVVATWYPDPANASNATYTIQHTDVGTGEYDMVVVDQRQSLGINTVGAYYFDTGSYTVQITDNADGNVVADAIALMYVDDPQMVTRAEFSADQNTSSGPMAVQFIDRSTVYIAANFDPEIQWQWDFGDLTPPSTEQNPLHTYTTPGTYTVSLTVMNEYGITDTEIKDSFIIVDSAAPLNAEFTAENMLGTGGSSAVNFLSQSTGDITEWLWDFGDLTPPSTEQNPTHTYVGDGVYTVTLTVTGPGGSDSETETDFVYITVGLVAADNTFDTKPHYYRSYSGTLLGSTIMDASPVALPNEEMQYSRFFFNGCVSENYYLPKFNRGVVFYTLGSRDAGSDPTDEYLINYLLGATDDEILQIINGVNYIHGYYDFNKLPPSMR